MSEGLKKIKAKRIDGPRAGEIHEFLKVDFDRRISKSNMFGVWEVIENKASAPKTTRKSKDGEEG